MTNPYSPPAPASLNDLPVQISQGTNFVVVGDSLFCRRECDLTFCCFETGETAETARISRKAWRPSWLNDKSGFLFLFLAGVCLVSVVYPWPYDEFLILTGMCLALAGGSYFSHLKIQIALTMTGNHQRSTKHRRWKVVFVRMGPILLAYTALEVTRRLLHRIGWLPANLGAWHDAYHNVSLALLSVGGAWSTTFGTRYLKETLVTRIDDDLYRIDNLAEPFLEQAWKQQEPQQLLDIK